MQSCLRALTGSLGAAGYSRRPAPPTSRTSAGAPRIASIRRYNRRPRTAWSA